MKVLIKLSAHADTVLVLPAEDAPAAAALISRAQMFKADCGYSSDPTYSPIEPSVSLRYMDDARLAGPSSAELEAKKEAQEKSSMWLREYEDHKKTKDSVKALEAKVEVLMASGGCRLDPATESEDEPVF